MKRPDASVVARKLALHTLLDDEARQALGNFLGQPHEFAAGALIARAGEPADLISIIGDGAACRMALLPGGGRQIHSILLAGDAADVEASLLLTRSDYIQAITRCFVWSIPKSRLAALPRTPNGLAEGFLREATITAETTREWVVNLGRRSANQRIAHLLCELCTRMDSMGVGTEGVYPFPFVQQDIADAQGLSVVHVNRVMKHLRGLGLFELRAKKLRVLNRKMLEETALFDAGYLHFQNAEAA
jgi:CRP-like cAMP-binding protein